jgi:hypothetical protein
LNEAALALELLLQLGEAYAKARALAEKAGVTKEDLDDADARFGKVYSDPLET